MSVWRKVVEEMNLEVGQPCSSKLESYVIVEDEEPDQRISYLGKTLMHYYCARLWIAVLRRK